VQHTVESYQYRRESEIVLKAGTTISELEEVGIEEMEECKGAGELEAKMSIIEETMEKVDDEVTGQEREILKQVLLEYENAFSFSDADIGHAER
jgi:hypothetical protein